MKFIEIRCDQCAADLTYTGNAEDWRLSLAPQAKDSFRAGAVTTVAMARHLDREHHFCSIGCLAAWMAEKNPNALQQYERQQKHRAWLKDREASAPHIDDSYAKFGFSSKPKDG